MTRLALAVAATATARLPVKAVADTIGVARPNLVDQLCQPERARRGPLRRAEDDYRAGHWEHLVEAKREIPLLPGEDAPILLAGERRYPPEDVGSLSGFEDFLRVMAETDHLGHEAMTTWYGGRSTRTTSTQIESKPAPQPLHAVASAAKLLDAPDQPQSPLHANRSTGRPIPIPGSRPLPQEHVLSHSAKSPSRISLATSTPSQQQHDGGGVEEGFG
jgi:hypothetical protein